MSKLSASVSVRARFARSANLELDEALTKLAEHAGFPATSAARAACSARRAPAA